MRSLTGLLIFVICLLWADTSLAQEITPRLFWPAPKGTKVFVSGYSFAQGDVLFDTSIPIEDADSAVNTGIFAYAQRLIFLAGHQTSSLNCLTHGEKQKAYWKEIRPSANSVAPVIWHSP